MIRFREIESQISIKTEDSPNNQQELRHCDLTSRADSIVVRPEGPISIKAEDSLTGQEIARRRKIVRHFFNDFWSSIDEKPGTFAERPHVRTSTNRPAIAAAAAIAGDTRCVRPL